MASDIANIRIEPADARWEIEKQTQIQAVADVASSLAGTSFHLQAGDLGTKYYVWFDTGADTDPAPAGRTAIEVTYTANDDAATLAGLIQAAIDAVGDFSATVDGDKVTVTNAAVGDAEEVTDVDTGFTFTSCQAGGKTELGELEGDIEVTFEEQTLEVTTHSTGTTPRADLRTGLVATLSLVMKESDLEKWKEIFGKGAGGSFTPAGGTEVFGWGDVKQGKNSIIDARRLILHPVALAAGDLTRDLCFWKAYPIPDSLVYSGENTQELSVTFKLYLDKSKQKEINLFMFGDHTQTGLAV